MSSSQLRRSRRDPAVGPEGGRCRIPVIAYDRELESAKALFITHDNVEVGRMIARASPRPQPTGNYAIIKGEHGQTNPVFLRQGMAEIIDPLIDVR